MSASAYSWTYVNASGKTIYETDDKFINTRNTVFTYLAENTDLNKAAICGILGNIYGECGFDQTIDAGAYHGLCMWTGDRWTSCQNFCKQKGYNVYSAQGQAAFIVYELNTSFKSTYNALIKVSNDIDGVFAAEDVFRTKFERCGTQGKTKRQNAAVAYFENIKFNPQGITTTTVKETECSPVTEAMIKVIFEMITQVIMQVLIPNSVTVVYFN